jgi:hypothetical protein
MDINPKDLERGYLDTGFIPEEGDNLGRIDEMARKEAKMERDEMKWAKMCGHEKEEDVGGFLERRNIDDRY